MSDPGMTVHGEPELQLLSAEATGLRRLDG